MSAPGLTDLSADVIISMMYSDSIHRCPRIRLNLRRRVGPKQVNASAILLHPFPCWGPAYSPDNEALLY